MTIVVQLKFGSPKSRFIWLCDSWPHLQLWQLKKQFTTLTVEVTDTET